MALYIKDTRRQKLYGLGAITTYKISHLQQKKKSSLTLVSRQPRNEDIHFYEGLRCKDKQAICSVPPSPHLKKLA